MRNWNGQIHFSLVMVKAKQKNITPVSYSFYISPRRRINKMWVQMANYQPYKVGQTKKLVGQVIYYYNNSSTESCKSDLLRLPPTPPHLDPILPLGLLETFSQAISLVCLSNHCLGSGYSSCPSRPFSMSFVHSCSIQHQMNLVRLFICEMSGKHKTTSCPFGNSGHVFRRW